MKKVFSVVLAVILFCSTLTGAFADSISFDPQVVNALERTSSEWTETSFFRANLAVLLSIDFADQLEEDNYHVVWSSGVYVTKSLMNLALIYMLEENAVLIVNYKPISGDANYEVTETGNLSNSEFDGLCKLVFEKAGTQYYKISVSDIADAAEFIASAIK